jgi:hypothetical protein
MGMDRRQFLQLTTGGVLASLTSAACAGDAALDARTIAQPALIGILGADRVRELGVRYRQSMPKENGAVALRTAISDGGRRGLRLPWTPHPSVAQQIRDDFAEGRTVLVNGWLLSVTEARQCALFSLAPT